MNKELKWLVLRAMTLDQETDIFTLMRGSALLCDMAGCEVSHAARQLAKEGLLSIREDAIKAYYTMGETGRTALYDHAVAVEKNACRESDLRGVADIFADLGSYRDAAARKDACLVLAEELRKDAVYADARRLQQQDTVDTLTDAISTYESIADWKDAKEQQALCRQRIDAIHEAERLAEEKKAEEERLEAERKAARQRKITRISVISVSAVCAVTALIFLFINTILPSIKYNKAVKLYENGDYGKARAIFYSIADYKDSLDHYKSITALAQTVTTDRTSGLLSYAYEYEAHGHVTKEIFVSTYGGSEEASEYSHEYEYDADGNIAKETITLLKGNYQIYEYKHDADGNTIETSYSDAKGKTYAYTTEYEYDANGHVTKISDTDKESGEITYTAEYEYDPDGNVTKESVSGKGLLSKTTEYQYDTLGNVILETRKPLALGPDTYEYKYDAKGNAVEMKRTSRDGEVENFQYSDFVYFKK